MIKRYNSRRFSPRLTRLEARDVPAVYSVTNLADSGPGSLRQAAADASANSAQANTITFTPGLTGTILLTSGEIGIGLSPTNPISIVGPGWDKLTVSGGNTSRVFKLNFGTLNIVDLGIAQGKSSGDGGAICTSNSMPTELQLSRVAISASTAAGLGGAIYSNNAVYLDQCYLTNNEAGGGGGGIAVVGTRSGAYSTTGSLVINNSTLENNRALGGDGGGVHYEPTFESPGNNIAQFRLRNSTLTANVAPSGGALSVTQDALWTSSIISIDGCTIVRNETSAPGPCAGIISVGTGGRFDIENTIVAENGDANLTGQDFATDLPVRLDYSAVGDTVGFSFAGGHNVLAQPLDLGSAQLNGGKIPTIMPNPGSPVRQVGANRLGLQYDQRGEGFPRSTGVRPDIGAVSSPLIGLAAAANVADVVNPGVSTYEFTVAYAASPAVDVASLDDADVRVTGPAGFDQLAKFVGVDLASDGPGRTARYRITAPGGTWNIADAGAYTVSLEPVQVFSTIGDAAPSGALDTFRCRIGSTYVVSNTANSGAGSLRQAVLDANAHAGPDVITFVPAVFSTPQTIIITGETPVITDELSIVGPGAGLLTIKPQLPLTSLVGPGTFFTSAVATSFSGLTFQSPPGELHSAIYVGGGGHLTLDGVDCKTNSEPHTSMGLAEAEDGASVITVRNGRFTGKEAGAIKVRSGGGLVVSQCQWLDAGLSIRTIYYETPFNAAVIDLGGLIENCTFANPTLGPITDLGPGTGLYFQGSSPAGALTIRNCTFSQNTLTGYNSALSLNLYLGTAIVQNSTFIGNVSGSDGGAITQSGPLATLVLQSCVVSGNTATGAGAPDIKANGTVRVDHCAIGSPAGFTSIDLGGNLPFGADLKLGALAENGGAVRTIMPAADSPLIDAGANPAGLNCDPRGAGFPRQVGAATDIGAAERDIAGPPPVRVSSAVFNGVYPQRSRVTSLVVTFDSHVMLPPAPESAFTLSRQDGTPVALAAAVNDDGPTTVVTLTFTAGPLEAGSLADGRYDLTVFAAQVSGGRLDGDGDGLSGDDYLLIGDPATNKLFRLFGDYNGDGATDNYDFLRFRVAKGSDSAAVNYNPAFDFNADGFIDNIDFIAFRQRIGVPV